MCEEANQNQILITNNLKLQSEELKKIVDIQDSILDIKAINEHNYEKKIQREHLKIGMVILIALIVIILK